MHEPSNDIKFHWDNSFAERMPGFFVSCDPAAVPDPVLLQFNHGLAEELGLNVRDIDPEPVANVFSGNTLSAGSQPLAQAYAGHQFGGFSPQLGDGRALLLGEVIDNQGRRRDIALKGSGRTPFSRGGDGKATIGAVLREYLIGEAMHALGIPTTRALAAVGTGESVRRERPLPGAILTRVAGSHIRVGTFEFFSARRQTNHVRALADFVIERHDPDLIEEDNRYLLLLKAVAQRQAALLAQWALVGFIHGVMNTDNMTVSGETIDYGPCAFMESYDPQAVFSSIDRNGRYAFANQPMIAQWNLARFAETLLPLIEEATPDRAVAEVTIVIEDFLSRYQSSWLSGVRAKLGIASDATDSEKDAQLAQDWLDLLQQHSVDFTLGWRRLADAADGNEKLLESLFPSADAIGSWLRPWRLRLDQQQAEPEEIASAMRGVNPIYIPRNHRVEEALTAATNEGDLALFNRLLDVTVSPYDEQPGLEDYSEPAPREFTACYKTFCGT
jgi:uncharacterized protein YdiU (UPF0061 family)